MVQFAIRTCITIVLAVGCAGCGAGYFSPVSSIPDQTETFKTDYRRLAECSYGRLDPLFATMLKKVDLAGENVVRVTAESGGVRYWELIFSGQSKNLTLTTLTITKNMWGTDAGGAAHKVLPEVRRCVVG